MNCLKELSFPNSLFGFSFSKYFLKICTVDHFLNWSAKCIIWTFNVCFCSNREDSFNCFFFRIWSFYLLHLLHLLIFNFKKTSNLINWKDFFRFNTFLTVDKYLFNNIRFLYIFRNLFVRRWWRSVLILASLLGLNFLIDSMLFIVLRLQLDDCWWLKRLSFIFRGFR